MAGKFQNRIDYVNISAYGFGKVNMAGEKFKKQGTKDSEKFGNHNYNQQQMQQNNQESRIIDKIKTFKNKTNSICLSLCALS